MDNKKLLGKRIKEIRKSKGLTQEQLSEMIDIETSSLSGIESGRFFPSLHVLEKIADVFDVELIEFFKFSSVNLPENIDKAIIDIIERQDKNNKRLIYKLLAAAFVTISWKKKSVMLLFFILFTGMCLNSDVY